MTGSACPPWRHSRTWWARRKSAFAHPTISDESVPDGDAGDVGMLQRSAYRFGLIVIEAGEAGPEQFAVAFGDDRFGERIGLRKQAVGLIARRVDALQRFAFAFQRADLDDPSRVGRDRLDGAVLLDGLLLDGLRLRAGSGIGV